MAKWITRDPIGETGGVNLYAFVLNNPVNWVDIWGFIWITKRYDYHGWSNWAKWYFNRLVSQIGKGLDFTFPGADPEELVGLKRDVIQEWVADPDNPCKDSKYPIGTIRIITQEYTKFINPGPDKVLINDPDSFYYYIWTPWVSNRTYSDYPNTRYPTLYYWKQGK